MWTIIKTISFFKKLLVQIELILTPEWKLSLAIQFVRGGGEGWHYVDSILRDELLNDDAWL